MTMFVTSALLALGVLLGVAPGVSAESYGEVGVEHGQPPPPSAEDPEEKPPAGSDGEISHEEEQSGRIQEAPTPGAPDTSGVRNWILSNIIPLVFLAVALLLLWLGGGKGDNAGVMRRLGGVIVALAVLGLALTGAGLSIGSWLATLFTE